MKAFPYDWQLFLSMDLAAMHLTPTQDTSLGVATMILINPDGSGQGTFRVAITGSQITGKIASIKTLIPEIPENLAHLYVSYFCNRAIAEPPLNSLATPWKDLEDLLRE